MLNVAPKILVVVGPTASGKSDLALRLTKLARGKPFKKMGINGAEIVSADSRQIYRGMDTGTAKLPFGGNPKSEIRNPKQIQNPKYKTYKGIRHYLVDIRNPNENYTVAEYKRDAIKAIRNILRRKKLPILVGGTGLYVRAVVDNLDIPKVKTDPKLRQNLELRIKNEGLDSLVKELLRLDPEAAGVVDLQNPRRVVRALEVALSTGEPFIAHRRKGLPLFDMLQIGIKVPPARLRARINRRVDEMLRQGLVKEVRKLVRKYGKTPVLLNTIGYKELLPFLASEVPPEEAVRQIKQNTWAYARRQMTWWRKDKKIYWVQTEKEAGWLTMKFLISGKSDFPEEVRLPVEN